MERIRLFSKQEVVAFIEELLQDNAATYEQEEMYIEYKWSGKLSKNNYTYKLTVREMKRIYDGF